MNIDEKFKDSSPIETVKKIQSILSSHGIDVEETWFDSGVKGCYCLRVTVKGTDFGSNGKGITKELARASGYAELMERMQAGYVRRQYFRQSVLNYADVKKLPFALFKSECGKWVKQIADGISKHFSSSVSDETVYNKIIEVDSCEDNSVTVLPFYDATTQEMTYYPQKTISCLYSTNGLAAGNNYDEAIVQGYSEVIERQNVIRAFFQDITPPTIPEEYLSQFENAYNTIQFLRNNGLNIIVKDCSFGAPFPILAVIAIDKANHSYQVRMGAHPVFEIAIERCLTEMFQGHTLKNAADISDLFIGNSKERPVSELVTVLTKGYGKYSSSFFGKIPTFEFKPFPDRSKMSNHQLVEEILAYEKGLGHHFLIRSVAHFGFPAIRIIIPGVSEALPNQLLDKFPHLNLMQKYSTCAIHVSSLDTQSKTEYLAFLNHQLNCYGDSGQSFQNISGVNVFGKQSLNTFYGNMLFSYLNWDTNKNEAIKIAKQVLAIAPENAKNYISCLVNVFDFIQESKDFNEIVEILSNFYPENILQYLVICFAAETNPFEPLIVHCDSSRCEKCRFNNRCKIVGTQKMIDTIQAAVNTYDNDAAFKELISVCK